MMNLYFKDKMDKLCHHGIKGQKWGVRRYQNADGSLTPAGKKEFVKILKCTNANTRTLLML